MRTGFPCILLHCVAQKAQGVLQTDTIRCGYVGHLARIQCPNPRFLEIWVHGCSYWDSGLQGVHAGSSTWLRQFHCIEKHTRCSRSASSGAGG
ncbi:hypothetical protein JB92DRAFT_2235591 [Gautieria morchelliformis]|nr:hypothetical protein JB92DRAFT_2235591 [Gautieria morchelliformis]